MFNTLHDPDTNFGPGFNKYIEGRTRLMRDQLFKVGALMLDISTVVPDLTARRQYETSAEQGLASVEASLSNLLDDVRAVRAQIDALPKPAPVWFKEAAE